MSRTPTEFISLIADKLQLQLKSSAVANAYVDAIMRMQHYYPNTQIVAMLPYYRTSQGNGSKVDRYNNLFSSICEHYGVPFVDLHCADADGNGTVNQEDAVYLLLHTLFGDSFYPLPKN